MEIDLDALLALAEKMPKGPWKVQHPHAGPRCCEVADRTGLEQVADRVTEERAQYIAAVNPAVIAELVRRLKASEAEARKYKLAGLGMAVSLGEHVCVPEGWKLVPVVPTVEMLDNVDCEVGGSCYSCSPWKASRTDSLNVWNEMIAAAPDLELRGS